MKAGRLADAVISFRKALQLDQTNAQVICRLGDVFRRQAKYREALAMFSRASELKPDLHTAHVAVAEVATALFIGGGRTSQELYDIAAKAMHRLEQTAPGSYDALRLKGKLAMLNRRYDEALEFLSKARAIRPEERSVTVPLVETLLGLDRSQDAERVALDTIQRMPAFSEMYDVLFQLYMQTNRQEEAGRLLERKSAALPQDVGAAIQLAAFHAAEPSGVDRAEQVLSKFVSDRKYPEAHLQAGNMYMRLRQVALARRHFEAGLAQKNKVVNAYRHALSTVHWTEGRQDDAIALEQAAVSHDGSDLEARRLRGSYLLSRGRPDDIEAAIGDYRAVLEQDPKGPVLNYQLGRAYRLKRDNKAAITYLTAAAQAPSYLAPKLLLAEIHAETGKYTETLRCLDEILAIDKENDGVRVLRAVALRALGREGESRAELQRVLRLQPGSRNAELELALLELAAGQPAKAAALLSRWHKPGASDPRVAAVLAESLVARKEYRKALEVLKAEIGARGSDTRLQLVAAQTAARSGDVPAAVSQLEVAARSSPQDATVLVRLAQFRMRAGQGQQAIEDLTKAVALAPNDAGVHETLGTALHLAGRTVDAISAYERSLQIAPGNLVAANNLAYLYTDQKRNLDEALRLARRAVQQEPDNLSYADTLAHVYAAKNMQDSAIQVMRGIVNKKPEHNGYRLRLARLLLHGGNKQGAAAELSVVSKAQLTAIQKSELQQLLAVTR